MLKGSPRLIRRTRSYQPEAAKTAAAQARAGSDVGAMHNRQAGTGKGDGRFFSPPSSLTARYSYEGASDSVMGDVPLDRNHN